MSSKHFDRINLIQVMSFLNQNFLSQKGCHTVAVKSLFLQQRGLYAYREKIIILKNFSWSGCILTFEELENTLLIEPIIPRKEVFLKRGLLISP